MCCYVLVCVCVNVCVFTYTHIFVPICLCMTQSTNPKYLLTICCAAHYLQVKLKRSFFVHFGHTPKEQQEPMLRTHIHILHWLRKTNISFKFKSFQIIVDWILFLFCFNFIYFYLFHPHFFLQIIILLWIIELVMGQQNMEFFFWAWYAARQIKYKMLIWLRYGLMANWNVFDVFTVIVIHLKFKFWIISTPHSTAFHQ